MCDGPTDGTGEKGASREMQDESRSASIRIIGLGNALRGDDAVGILAAHQLQRRVGNHAEVIEAEMVGVDLIELMKGARVIILIDAARSGLAPGTIHRLEASDSPISKQLFPCSTHAIGMSDALELARIMGVLPSTVVVYGVEAGNTEAGQPLSPPVATALDQVVDQILKDCEACRA